jgi:hypothetical protein
MSTASSIAGPAMAAAGAIAEKIDTLEALQNTTFGLDGAFAFETGMLAHKSKKNGGGEWSLICRKATLIPRKICKRQIPAKFDSNGHSTENDNATFISPFVNFFPPIRLVR